MSRSYYFKAVVARKRKKDIRREGAIKAKDVITGMDQVVRLCKTWGFFIRKVELFSIDADGAMSNRNIYQRENVDLDKTKVIEPAIEAAAIPPPPVSTAKIDAKNTITWATPFQKPNYATLKQEVTKP